MLLCEGLFNVITSSHARTPEVTRPLSMLTYADAC
jgi:hypothetical protein